MMRSNDRIRVHLENATHSLILSARWRMSLYIFFINTVLYMHRVNLSLAVVCMVGTPTDYSGLVANATNFSTTNIIRYHFDSDNTSDLLTTTSSIVVLTPVPTTHSSCGIFLEEETDQEWSPELDWDKAVVSILLSSYFYGCFFTQIPAGAMADIFGGKHIMTVVLALTGACALLTPVCARTSIYLLFIVRIILGLAGVWLLQGAMVPVWLSILMAWAPPAERAVMHAFCSSGQFFGTIVSYLTSGVLCVYGFDNGWPSIFYIHGGMTLLFLCFWVYDSASTPSKHPRISSSELQYINSTTKHISKKPSKKTPWKRLLMSKPLWSSCVAHFSYNWSFFTILINIPLFLKEVLQFNIKENGVFSALPYMCAMVSILVSGKTANVIIIKRVFSVLTTRRLFTVTSLLGSGACLIIAGHVTCNLRHLAVVLLCLSSSFCGMSWAGLFVNFPEFAGQYSGTALGISNSCGIISALLASMFAGMLTPDSTQSQWQTVFYIAAGFNVLGAILFATCSTANLEPWATEDMNVTFTVDEKTLEIQKLNETDIETNQI